METQRDELLARLAEQGWEAAPVDRGGLEWWTDEVWLLVSRWSPVGTEAYLTFVVHPLFDAPDRKKGYGVCSAMASGGKPQGYYWAEDSFEIGLNHGWKERMPELLAHLSRVRDRRKAEGIDGG